MDTAPKRKTVSFNGPPQAQTKKTLAKEDTTAESTAELELNGVLLARASAHRVGAPAADIDGRIANSREIRGSENDIRVMPYPVASWEVSRSESSGKAEEEPLEMHVADAMSFFGAERSRWTSASSARVVSSELCPPTSLPVRLYEEESVARKTALDSITIDRTLVNRTAGAQEFLLRSGVDAEGVRLPLLPLLLPLYSSEKSRPQLEFSIPVEMPALQDVSAKEEWLNVEFEEMEFAPGDAEPLLITACLYDLSKNLKLSEDAHVDLNRGKSLSLLSPKWRENTQRRLERSFGWPILPEEDLPVILLTFSKILTGTETDKVADLYGRSRTEKDYATKVIKYTYECRDHVERLGSSCLQRLFWTTLSLPAACPIDSPIKLEATEFKVIKDGASLLECLQGNPSHVIRGKLTLSASRSQVCAPSAQAVAAFYGNSLNLPYLSPVHKLYISPQQVLFSALKKKTVSARNILIKARFLQTDSDPQAEGLPYFITRWAEGEDRRISEVSSTVAYHHKNPKFLDEFQLNLPLKLSPQAHIVFRFYHVACKKSVQGDDALVHLGYAVLPLYADHIFCPEISKLSVITEAELPPWYLSSLGENNKAELSYLDEGKPCFTVHVRLVSSMLSQNQDLNKFFKFYPIAFSDADFDRDVVKSLQSLEQAELGEVAAHFPVIAHRLIRHTVERTNDVVGEAAFHCLLVLVARISAEEGEYSPLLIGFLDYVQPKDVGVMLNALLVRWLSALTHSTYNAACLRQWPFLSAWLLRCIVLLPEGAATEDIWTMLSEIFTLSMTKVEAILTTAYMTAKVVFGSLCVCLREMSFLWEGQRGRVLRLSRDALMLVKDARLFLDGFRLLIDMDNFVALHAPPPELQPTVLPVVDWYERLSSSYFLVGWLTEIVFCSLSHPLSEIRGKALSMACELLWRCEMDGRWDGTLWRSALGNMFFTFVLGAVKYLPVIKKWLENSHPTMEERRHLFTLFLFPLKYMKRSLLTEWWENEVPHTLCCFLELCEIGVSAFSYRIKIEEIAPSMKHQAVETNKLALESLYAPTAKRTSRRGSGAAAGGAATPSAASTMDDGNIGTPSKRLSRFSAARASGGLPTPPVRTSSAFHARKKSLAANASPDVNTSQGLTDAILRRNVEGCICTEVTIVIVDVLQVFLECHREDFCSAHPTIPVRNKAAALILTVMGSPLSQESAAVVFPLMRWIALVLVDLLFWSEDTFCREVSKLVLRFSNSPFSGIRSEAAALLFLLIKENKQNTGTFARMKMLTTVSLSEIVAGEGFSSSDGMKQCFGLIKQYAECFDHEGEHLYQPVQENITPQTSPLAVRQLSGTRARSKFRKAASKVINQRRYLLEHRRESTVEEKNVFVSQINDLCNRLTEILHHLDSLKQLISADKDEDKLIDLYLRIADGYASAPALRITWLQSLGKLHQQAGRYMEAAMCYMHITFLLALQLRTTSPRIAELDEGRLLKIAPSCSFEASFYEEVSEVTFNEQQLVVMLNQAVAHLKLSQLFLAAVQVDLYILPLFEMQRDYKKASDVHLEVQTLYSAAQAQKEACFPLNFHFVLRDEHVYRLGKGDSNLGADIQPLLPVRNVQGIWEVVDRSVEPGFTFHHFIHDIAASTNEAESASSLKLVEVETGFPGLRRRHPVKNITEIASVRHRK